MPIINITSLDHPGVEVFSSLTEAQLRSGRYTDKEIFIAESPKVIHVALNAGYRATALLCERRHIDGDAAAIISRIGDVGKKLHTARSRNDQVALDLRMYLRDRELLASLTGYTLTRGVLCAMERPDLPTIADICRTAHRIAVIHGVVDTTNIGAIFRSAAALGIDAIALTTDSCDPLNRRSVRVSMGSVFLIPWTWIEGSVQQLNDYGFKTAAMALTDRSISIDDPRLPEVERLAIVLGTEGDGLPHTTIEDADYVVRIPMSHQVDSLNVAAASAVAFWELRKR